MPGRLRRILSVRMPWPYGKNKSGPPVTITRDVVHVHVDPSTGRPCEHVEVTQTVTKLGKRWAVRMVSYCECGWREERRVPEEEKIG